jgi:hypothetical protein
MPFILLLTIIYVAQNCNAGITHIRTLVIIASVLKGAYTR